MTRAGKAVLGRARNKLRTILRPADDAPSDAEKKLRRQLKEARRMLSVRDRELAEARSGTPEPTLSLPGEAPFFILGPPKSGTSWLQATLASHPEIYCSGEAKFFGRDFRTENPYGQWGGEVSAAMTGLGYQHADRASLYGALADSKDLKAWFNRNGRWTKNEDTEKHVRAVFRLSMDYVFAHARAESGKKIVGDKSPSHIQYIEEIGEFYPESRVIHIIRDGRDQAVSSVFHWWRQGKDRGGFFPISPDNAERRDAYYESREAFGSTKRSIFDTASVKALASHWRETVGRAREAGPRLFGERYYEVKYEDLQKSPERYFGEMARFLGASAEEGIIAEIAAKNSFEAKSERKLGTEDPKSFLRSGKAGGWKDHFTGRDRKIYEEEAGELLAKLGYGTDDSR